MDEEFEFVFTEAEAQKAPRLDAYLVSKLSDYSRARLQKLIESGDVQVNGQAAKAGMKLRVGDIVRLVPPPPEILDAEPEDIPLDIIYEDEHLLVINKPAGMVVHPGAGVKSSTLVNAVLHHCRGSLSSIGGTIRPGIVHRLDKDTSGLIMVAKSDLAHRGLSAQLKAKTARRSYIALAEGAAKEESGTINLPIGRHATRRTEMAVLKEDSPGARAAVTHYQVLKRYTKYTLVALELETGRTHQIRVHLAHLGLPIAGDLVYNRKSDHAAVRRKLGLAGQALHAAKLRFTHPASGLLLEFEAKLPEDFERAVSALK